jgi:hypothetical protein
VQQCPSLDLEPASNARDVVEGDIAFGPFEPAEIGVIDTALVGQPPQLLPLTRPREITALERRDVRAAEIDDYQA